MQTGDGKRVYLLSSACYRGGGIPESLESVADAYLKMIDGQMERIICAILKAESNVLYFCGAGKDRTGVVSAKRRFAGIVTVSIHKELMD